MKQLILSLLLHPTLLFAQQKHRFENDTLYTSCGYKIYPGQVLVLELRLAGFYRLPVAFRIREIDRASGVIEFVYLEANKSNGKQRLEFAPAIGPDGERRSTIRHSTWYRSGDEFRDERLYGGFHASIIDAFHRAVVESAGYSIAVVES